MRRPLISGSDVAARILSHFDLYSSRWTARVAVGCAFAAIVACVLRQSLAVVFPIAVLVVANGRSLAVAYTDLLDRRPWLVVIVPLGVLGYVCASPAPTAADDLLRHIAANLRPGGYGDLYAHATLAGPSFYWGFDRMVGSLARAFGPAGAMWAVQAVAGVGFCVVYLMAAWRVADSAHDRVYWAVGGLFLALGVMLFRVILGRPEIFMTIWLIAALIPTSRAGIVVWAISGFFLSWCYWAAPVYFVGVLLLACGWRLRLTLFCSLAAGWAASWLVITGGSFFVELASALGGLGQRIPEIRVGENQSIFATLGQPAGVVLLVACGWALTRPSRRNDIGGFALLFLLTNQSRYVSVVGPLLSLFAISAARTMPLNWHAGGKPAFVLILSILAVAPFGHIPRYDDLPAFRLPDGSIVLTAFDEATYGIPFTNTGRVRVSPSFEIGATQPEVQKLVYELTQGRLDCARVTAFDFTHVVETRLSGSLLPCLRLEATQGAWRLWRVVREERTR